MDTPVHKGERLLRALEELVELEGLYLRSGYYDLAGEVRDRASPLVAHLIELAPEPGCEVYRERVAIVIQHSQEHAELLQQKMDVMRREIGELAQARQRSGQVLPAYARRTPWALPRFLAAG